MSAAIQKQTYGRVDYSALRVNQTGIILFNILAFVLNVPLLVAFVAVVMAVGTIFPQAGLFKLAYLKGLKPAGLLKPDVKEDDPAAHLFAQGLGAVFLIAALAAFALNAPVAGWALTGIVVALAAINLFFGFCAGCFMYFQLGLARFAHRVPVGS